MTSSRSIEPNLTTRLLQSLTPEQETWLRQMVDEASSRHIPLYIVGGFVRDLLLGHPSLDFDLVVEGDAVGLARAIAAKHGGKVTVHTRFKTAQWFPLPAPGIPQIVDFTSARSESYKHPAALPTVKPGTLANDLCRRDFTINTLALRLDGDHFGELRDDLGGLEDLQAGFIRVLHPNSFADDTTRLFRVIRYEQRYGFQIAPETLALIPDTRQLIECLSAERVRHELDLILEEEKAACMLKRLAQVGILAAVHPNLKWKQATNTRLVNGLAAAQELEHAPSRRALGWTLWLMDVPLPSLRSIESRLHFESGLREMLLAASTLLRLVNSLTSKKPSRCVAILDPFPLRAVQSVALALPAGPKRKKLRDYLETWKQVRPKTTGYELKKRGLPPGPAYKSILQRLRGAWLDGEVNSVNEEMVLLDGLTRKYSK